MRTEIEDPLARRIRAAANGPHGRMASATVKSATGGTPALWLGRGDGVPAAVALGSEFGGRGGKKRLVIQKSSRGRRYVARRRTTMQFRPHLGTRGYWFVPTMKRHFPQTMAKVVDITEDVLLKIPYLESTGGKP